MTLAGVSNFDSLGVFLILIFSPGMVCDRPSSGSTKRIPERMQSDKRNVVRTREVDQQMFWAPQLEGKWFCRYRGGVCGM